MYDVIGIGSALVDTLMLVNGFPLEDTKMQSHLTKQQAGGPCATALVAMSKLGVSSAYMGIVGDDMNGKLIIDEFKKYHVGTECMIQAKDCVSSNSFVLLNTLNSSRTCVWTLGSIPSLKTSDINLEELKNARFLHLDGHQLEAAISASIKAHEFGLMVSLDAGGTYPGIERLLPHIDILIPSEEFALKITGSATAEEAIKVLHNTYKPKILVITQGEAGGIIYHEDTLVRYPAYEVALIDTNGAGDVFHGAFIAAMAKGANPLLCANFASAAAALKCTKLGAREGVPSYEEVIAFLKTNGVNNL